MVGFFFGARPEALEQVAARHGDELAKMPLRLEVGDAYGWTAADLRERAAALRAACPEPNGLGSAPFLLVLDYLQVIADPPGVRRDLRERIADAAYSAKMVARDFGAAVLLISSVAREKSELLSPEAKPPLGEGDPCRLVGLGKESGEIEFGADVVMALGRKRRGDGYSEMALAIAKMRGGETSWCTLHFNGGWFRESREAVRA